MARATEEVVFQRFLGTMVSQMKISKTVLVATTVQLYSADLILQVHKNIMLCLIAKITVVLNCQRFQLHKSFVCVCCARIENTGLYPGGVTGGYA